MTEQEQQAQQMRREVKDVCLACGESLDSVARGWLKFYTNAGILDRWQGLCTACLVAGIVQ